MTASRPLLSVVYRLVRCQPSPLGRAPLVPFLATGATAGPRITRESVQRPPLMDFRSSAVARADELHGAAHTERQHDQYATPQRIGNQRPLRRGCRPHQAFQLALGDTDRDVAAGR
jgi:hypothetical protein